LDNQGKKIRTIAWDEQGQTRFKPLRPEQRQVGRDLDPGESGGGPGDKNKTSIMKSSHFGGHSRTQKAGGVAYCLVWLVVEVGGGIREGGGVEVEVVVFFFRGKYRGRQERSGGGGGPHPSISNLKKKEKGGVD